MRQKLLLKFIGAIILFFGNNSLSAQDTTALLDPVTVTANFSPTQLSKTGRNVIIVRGEQLTQLPVHSIDELLRYLPGIEIQARGPMGVQSDISVRGATFQQVLVILDGVRLNDPLTGHFSSYIPLPASEIDRIEILKGASSAIYGTEAVGGVIHIITKTFARKQTKEIANVQIMGGEYGFWSVNSGFRYQKNNSIISGGILTNHANGQPQRGTNGFFDVTSVSLSFSQKLNKAWLLALRSSYDDRSFSAQNFYTTFISDTAKETVKTYWQQAQLVYSRNNFKFITDIGYKKSRDKYLFNKALLPNDNKSGLFQILSRTEWKLLKTTLLTTGVQFIEKNMISNDRGNHKLWQSAFFAAVNQQIGQRISIDPSIRLDYHQKNGVECVPQLNFSFRGKQYQLRASAGRTIRDADFTERYNNFNRSRVTSGSIGNPDLAAENAWSVEGGGDVWLGKSIKLGATIFGRYQKQLIDWIPTPYTEMPRKVNLIPTGTYALAKNIAKVNTTGLEADFATNFELGGHQKIEATLGLLWLQSKSSQGTPGFYLSSHARFLGNFTGSYQVKWLRITTTALYKSRQSFKAPAIQASITPNYTILNTKFEILSPKSTSLFIQIDNIGNKKYSDLLGSTMPLRWTMLGASIRW